MFCPRCHDVEPEPIQSYMRRLLAPRPIPKGVKNDEQESYPD